MAEFRKQERDRLSAVVENNPRSALRQLQTILSEAIQEGADSVELEYVAEGLEVTTVYGDSGIGWVLADRVLAAEVISLLVERAKLQNRAHGVMEWSYGGKPYLIKVEEHEHFGESAFRLILGRSGRKRA